MRERTTKGMKRERQRFGPIALENHRDRREAYMEKKLYSQ